MVGSSSCVIGVVEKKKGLDATVGGLVWVQRKNGSWWPGQIVGAEELSENDLATPRSGTPIKLLGRDDTSVDWYDFGTTRVVKPFRCGEYDACIQKAEISAANNSLKFTKYPRRENAIVCALKIEKNNLFKDNPDNDLRLNGEKGSASMSHSAKDGEYLLEETESAREEISNSTQELSHSGISFEGTNGFTHIKDQHLSGRKPKTLNDSEDDGYDGAKRMKGLSDLAMVPEKIAPVLVLPTATSENNAPLNNLCTASGVSMGNNTNGSSISTAKRKRSQVIPIHELLKRDFQRRPATKVLENTTMVPVPIICDEFANPFERSDTISPCYDSENGDEVKNVELTNWLLPEDDSSDSLFDVPFFDEKHPSASAKPYIESFRGHSSFNIKIRGSSCDYKALDESASSYLSAGHGVQTMDKSASKWQLKGKRNSRHTIKAEDSYSIKRADLHDKSDGYICHENSGWLAPSSSGFVNGSSDLRNRISVASTQRPFLYNQSRFSAHSSIEMADVSPRIFHTDSLLYEVEVTVEASRPQLQHVPYISLMSKLNGKPITGHPVAVEVLENGICDLPNSDYPASVNCESEDRYSEIAVVIEPKVPREKKDRNRSRNHCKRSKSRKRHGSSSKKTRKLSSLTGAHKLSLVKSRSMSRTPKGPTLACIPLKVVFSRINEALNGSRSVHHLSNP